MLWGLIANDAAAFAAFEMWVSWGGTLVLRGGGGVASWWEVVIVAEALELDFLPREELDFLPRDKVS